MGRSYITFPFLSFLCRCISEINQNKGDQLALQIALEQLQEHDQLLIAHNDMLKVRDTLHSYKTHVEVFVIRISYLLLICKQMDKSNLQKRVAELDIMVKKLFKVQESQPRNQPQNASSSRSFEFDFAERLAHSQKALSRVNSQLAQYHRPDSTCPNGKANAGARETKLKGEFRVL